MLPRKQKLTNPTFTPHVFRSKRRSRQSTQMHRRRPTCDKMSATSSGLLLHKPSVPTLHWTHGCRWRAYLFGLVTQNKVREGTSRRNSKTDPEPQKPLWHSRSVLPYSNTHTHTHTHLSPHTQSLYMLFSLSFKPALPPLPNFVVITGWWTRAVLYICLYFALLVCCQNHEHAHTTLYFVWCG